MQLVAYGAQDTYLSGNPQITFFKVVYRRHTNFALESIEQTFSGTANFGKKVQCTISRNGDLIHKIYLQATLPEVKLDSSLPTGSQFRWLEQVGHNLIKSVELEIGGQRIDKHYGDWMSIWAELTMDAGKRHGYDKMIGDVAELKAIKTKTGTDCEGGCAPGTGVPATGCAPEYTVYVPLQFWFCRNPGLALPLIALQYHEVKINLEFNELRNLIWTSKETTAAIPASGSGSSAIAAVPAVTAASPEVMQIVSNLGLQSASLYVDYVYLDTDERRRFAQASHEYLIEQLQFTGGESITAAQQKLKLGFNHPVKELVWVVQKDTYNSCSGASQAKKGAQPFNFSDQWEDVDSGAKYGKNPVAQAKLQLNGHDRFSERDGSYFSWVQPFQHHTNVPTKEGINVYSFALRPEEHQPSGSCNFSRIDNATLILNMTANTVNVNSTAQVRVYAINYNILRVMAGMGGLAYSN